jgi:hypothetical protein
MTPDPELILETKAWFKKAAHDIRMAELALGDDPAMTDQAVYHAQQAAEKAMKGLLTWHERIFRKTHNLVELCEACAGLLPDLEPRRRPGEYRATSESRLAFFGCSDGKRCESSHCRPGRLACG